MALNLKTETVFSGDAPRAQPPLPPEQIAPHFPQLDLIEYLGRGGMGVVYKARQKTLNRFVALKLLAPERVNDPKFAERFTREAQALAALNHPNIVTIHDFGQAGGFYYLLMEYVDGMNLRHLLRARKFTPEEALAIVPSLCDALQFAHERGIVHRDIKPENILLDKAGRVKIADFGIVRMLGRGLDAGGSEGVSSANATQSALGTPGYSAPEQKTGPERVDSRADIYSLGVVFYEMLTGELPGKRIEPPSRKVHLDVRLDAVVLRALEKTPELRWQTAAELRTQVETIAATPRGSSRGEPAQAEGGRNPALLKSERARLVVQESPGASVGEPKVGEVALHEDRLVVSSGYDRRSIPLAEITALGEAVMPWWYHPGGHRYAAVDFREGGQTRRLVFMPGTPLFRLPSNSGVQAAEWIAAIQAAVKAGTGASLGINHGPMVVPVKSGWAVVIALTALMILGFLMVVRLCFRPMPSTGLLPVVLVFGVPLLGLAPALIYRFAFLRRGRSQPENARNQSGLTPALVDRGPRSSLIAIVTVALLAVLLLALVAWRAYEARQKQPQATDTVTGPPFVARLAQLEVELVAIGNQPWANRVCWLANGQPSDELFPNDSSGSMDDWATNRISKKVAFRIHSEDANGPLSWPVSRVNPESGVSTGSAGTQRPDHRSPDTGFIQLIACPTNAQTMNVSLGVANGPWETPIALENTSLGGAHEFSSPTEGDWIASYSTVTGSGGDMAVSCVYSKNEDWESRMVYVNSDGKVIPIPENSRQVNHGQTGATLLVSTNEFARIKEFQLQRRKYQWVEFGNVSLQPGHRTTVEIRPGLSRSRGLR